MISICPLSLAGTLLYDFDNGDLKDWEESGKKGEWRIENGELSGEFRGFPSSDLVLGSEDWSDYVLECKVKFIETFAPPEKMTWAGVVVRYQDTGNTCVFAIDLSKQRVNVDLEVAGKEKIWKSFPLAVEKNKYYKLKISVKDNHYQFFVDDDLKEDFEDDSFSTGKVGVLVIRAHSHFDDFVIEGEGINGVIGQVKKIEKLITTWAKIKREY